MNVSFTSLSFCDAHEIKKKIEILRYERPCLSLLMLES